MRLRRYAVALALGFGVVAWLLDALIMCVILDSGALVDCLILGLSAADWVRRIGVLVLFGVVGALLAEPSDEEAVSTDEPESDETDTGQFAYAAQIMMIGLDRAGSITLFNRRCEEVTGHDAEAVVGTSFFDHLLPSRALPNILPAFHSVLENGTTLRRETAWLTRSGPEIVVNSHLSPVLDEGGEIVGVVIVAQDVTEYRLTDAELLLSREPWRPLAESVMGDGMAAIDADGILTWVSLSLAEMLGEEREVLIGQRLEQLVFEHDRERLRDGLSRVNAQKATVNEEFIAGTVDTQMPVQIALQPLDSGHDEAAGAFAIVRDLTAVSCGRIAADTAPPAKEEELVRLREQLEAAEARAEEAGEAARAESAEEIEALQAELASAQERVAEVERDAEARLDELRDRALEERQAQVAELTAKLKAAEARAEEAGEAAKREVTSQLSGLSARASEAEKAVEAARAENEREVEELRERLSTARAEAEAAESEVREGRETVESLREDLSAAREEAAAAIRRAELSEQDAGELRAQLDAAREAVHDAEQAAARGQQVDEHMRERVDALRERLAKATREAKAAAEQAHAERERAEGLEELLREAESRADQAEDEAGAESRRVEDLRDRLTDVTEKLEMSREQADDDRGQIAKLRERLDESLRRADEAEVSAREQQRRAEGLAEKLEVAQREVDVTREEYAAQVAELEESLQVAEEEAASAREDAGRQVEDLNEQLQSVRAEAERRESESQGEVKRLSEELTSARTHAEKVRAEAEGERRELAALREELETAEAAAEKARGEQEAQQAKIAELTARLSEVEAAAERRASELTEQHRREIEELARELAEAEERIERVRAESDERMESARAALAERQKELDELAAALEAAERRVDEVRRKLTEEHEARVEELQSTIEAVEARAEEALAEQQSVIDGLRAELTEAEERLEAARREAETRAETARREALAEREAEVAGLNNELRQAEARAEEIAEEAQEAYAQMLARMSEQLASIERDAAAKHEVALERQQEKIAELRDQLEDAERRAADARRLAREEYEKEIAQSLAEASAIDERLVEAREEARGDFEREIRALTEQLADAERRIEEARQGGDEDRRGLEKSLEFLRTLLDGIPYPVFFMDADGRYQSCNLAFARNVLGLTRSEVLGHTPEELRERISEGLLEQLDAGDSEILAGGEEIAWEARAQGPDRTMRSWAFRKEPYVEDGEVVGITGAMIDISGLEAAERELEQERERSATVLERAPMIMAEISPEGVVSAIYGDAEELLGWSAGELVGRDWWGTLFPGELAEPMRDVLGAMRSGGDLEDRALELRTKSGEERVFSWSTSNVRTADRELLSILMVGVDITDRAREEETLEVHFREAVERVKKHRCLSNTLRLTQDTNLSLVEVLSGIVASLPEAWRYPGITTARGCVWGRERSFGESPYEPVASISSEVVAGGEVVGEIEVRYHEEREEMAEGPFTIEERELLDSVTAHLGDMIERRSAEESLARLRLFRHSLIDQANLWLMALDRDRNVVLWNRAAERVSGYARNEVIGNDRVWAMLFPDPAYREEVLSRLHEVTLGNTSAEDWETVVRAKDGTERTVSWYAQRLIDDNDGSTLGAVALGRDITKRRAAASNS